MKDTPTKRIYIEAWRPNLQTPNWCAEFTDVNHEIYRPELGGWVGYFSMALWPTWYKIEGKTVTVVFVSNAVFYREEAIQISSDIIEGKVRRVYVDLSEI